MKNISNFINESKCKDCSEYDRLPDWYGVKGFKFIRPDKAVYVGNDNGYKDMRGMVFSAETVEDSLFDTFKSNLEDEYNDEKDAGKLKDPDMSFKEWKKDRYSNQNDMDSAFEKWVNTADGENEMLQYAWCATGHEI